MQRPLPGQRNRAGDIKQDLDLTQHATVQKRMFCRKLRKLNPLVHFVFAVSTAFHRSSKRKMRGERDVVGLLPSCHAVPGQRDSYVRRTSVSQPHPFVGMLLLISFLTVPIHSAFHKLTAPHANRCSKAPPCGVGPSLGNFQGKAAVTEKVEECESVGQ